MVSIPDFSKFRGLGEAHRKALPSLESRYYKQREEEYIKQAEERGYFLQLSRNLIEEKFLSKNDVKKTKKRISILDKLDPKEQDLSEIRLIKLTNARLRNVGELGLCSHLTICILSNNYITHIEGLAPCVNLIKLDLHSNQVQYLS